MSERTTITVTFTTDDPDGPAIDGVINAALVASHPEQVDLHRSDTDQWSAMLNVYPPHLPRDTRILTLPEEVYEAVMPTVQRLDEELRQRASDAARLTAVEEV